MPGPPAPPEPPPPPAVEPPALSALDQVSSDRDRAGGRRDRAGGRRDQAGQQRDLLAKDRDSAGARRDAAAGCRDEEGQHRDVQALERDLDADGRDRVTERLEESVARAFHAAQQALAALTAGRRTAAEDRQAASHDRAVGNHDRTSARLDRATASTDRGAGARERTMAGEDRETALADRETALADRGDSTRESHVASIDSLTGSYLRGPGLAELDREIARAQRTRQPLTLAFADVDGLKTVNDTQGHGAGDRLLTQVAHCIQGALRPYDLVIRVGGDEFVCVVAGMGLADAAARFTSVNAVLESLCAAGSVSVGLAELRDGEARSALIGRADAALYRARASRLSPELPD